MPGRPDIDRTLPLGRILGMAKIFLKRDPAFTITELLVVTLIIAALASMGIPQYRKTHNQAILRDLREQLITLHNANKIYYAQIGQYLDQDFNDLNALNAALNTHIIPTNSDVQYDYIYNDPDAYTITATYWPDSEPSKMFVVQVTQEPLGAANPSCSAAGGAGACPW